MATAAGIATVICNGLRAGALEAVLAGRAARGRGSAAARGALQLFKLWLKYAKPRRGTLVDRRGRRAGAARGQREPAARSASSRWRRVRRRRRGRDRRARRERTTRRSWRRASATTPPQELRRVIGHEVGGRARDPAARHRGGRAPRLPRASAEAPYPWRHDGNAIASITVRGQSARAAKRAARSARAASTPPTRTRRCEAIAAALQRARTAEILEANERDMEAGREAEHRRGAARPAAPGRGADRADRAGGQADRRAAATRSAR